MQVPYPWISGNRKLTMSLTCHLSNKSQLKNVNFSFVLFILLIYEPAVKQRATEKLFCLNVRTANRSYTKIRERSSKCKENSRTVCVVFSFLWDIVINQIHHMVKTVHNGIL